MKEILEDIACGVVFILVVAAIFWAILSIPAGAQTSQADSTFGAISPENILLDSSHVAGTIKVWDAPNWGWEDPLTIRGDSLFIDDSTFVLLQRLNKPKFGWITDSITWVPIDTTFAGDCRCEHDWVLDATRPGNVDIHLTFGLEIMDCTKLNPDGKHCNEHQSATREKICHKCMRGEIEREQWFQHFVVPPKSEFELLKEKQNARHR